MAEAIKSAIRRCRHLGTGPNSNVTQFLDEELAAVSLSDNREDFCRQSNFLPMIVLIPKSAVRDRATRKASRSNESIARLTDSRDAASLLDSTTRFTDPSASDACEFGEVTVCFSTMEIHRNGRPVPLTRKEFKTLTYLIKNARRVVSRDELLNEVWGYQCYPCTRTVDNHLLRLRKKLETDPAHPKHFRTVHGVGYRFLP